MFGFLNVYKPKGKTSHDVVAILRRLTKIKQIGHTGTLDPFAEGVLPICIGKTTKLIEFLKDDKAYIGTVKLGQSTTTYDTEGEVVNTSNKTITLTDIENSLCLFRGEILQTPPIYSAIKVNGKKLYEYARKDEMVEIEPRKVCINKLELLNYNQNTQELDLYIECSKGTYIRSLANDIGEHLGSYGYLNKLVRTRAGNFIIENSVKLDDIKTIEDVLNRLENPLQYLNYPTYQVNENEYKIIANGNKINVNLDNGTTLLTNAGEIIAVGSVQDGILKPQKVFI